LKGALSHTRFLSSWLSVSYVSAHSVSTNGTFRFLRIFETQKLLSSCFFGVRAYKKRNI